LGIYYIMKYIITESQYKRLLLENNYMNFWNNFDVILQQLLQVPEFREDLKNHSYNKEGYLHWWKGAKEDMENLIRDKYCALFRKLGKKYKFKFELDWSGEIYFCGQYANMFGEAYFHKLRGNRYVGDDAPIDDGKYYYEGPPWVSEFFMKTFYGK
jgi:hypothetical protein